MSEVKDHAIKLFGKTIPLLLNEQVSVVTTPLKTTKTHVDSDEDHDDNHQQHHSTSHQNLLSSTSCSTQSQNRVEDVQENNQKPSQIEVTETRQEDPAATSCENPKTPSVEKEHSSSIVSKNDEQSETSNNSQEKTLKKPDKILPCPRCNSMDTKFCYFNNYNVNQPRHFCKKCQRYWTAGGTMRNVPVGSGRRKNKNASASHYRHILVAQADVANGTVLSFGSDSPLCESMDSALTLAEKSQKISVSCGARENGDERSSRSSITGSDSAERGGNSILQESVTTNFQNLNPQVPCFSGPPWPCQWNPPQWRTPMPQPAFGPSGFPITVYPAPPYWGCALPGSWNVPWISPDPATCSSPNSPILGKHSRDWDVLKPSNSEKEEALKENNSERCVWIPKTLRIDDPSQAAKSSIWSTLGIKNEKKDSINTGGLFKAFQSKGDEKNHIDETSLVLQANPAALSRSLNFQESG
ncbi:hypothetical protein ACSBR2_006463 [Camellia fascicularis]